MKDHSKFWEMPLDVQRWLTSPTRLEMTLAERGLYLELLAWQWYEGDIPASPAGIAKLLSLPASEIEGVLPVVRRQFVRCSRQRMRNERLEQIRVEKLERKAKRAAAGSKGGLQKANNLHDISSNARDLLQQKPTNHGSGYGSGVVSVKTPRLEDPELQSLYKELQAIFPPNHNPKPDLAFQMLLSREGAGINLKRMLADLKAKFLPAYASGRAVPDLHNWVRDYHVDADIGPVERNRDNGGISQGLLEKLKTNMETKRLKP